jgi:hypothetical protein
MVYPGGWYEAQARDRTEAGLRDAEERRLARLARSAPGGSAPGGSAPGGFALRARAARRLFEFAVLLERDETWRVVWERLEAPRRS